MNAPTLQRRTIAILGGLAVAGCAVSVLADFYSAYHPRAAMDSAVAVGLDSVIDIFRAKPQADMAIGSYLGQYFLPFHALGLVLVYYALRPAHEGLALACGILGIYAAFIGTSVHASLVYLGVLAKTSDPAAVALIEPFFNSTTYSMVAIFGAVSTVMALLILGGKSAYARWMVAISPLGYTLITTVLVTALPDSAFSLKAFITVTGFNLPMTIFYAVTTALLLRRAA